MTRKETSDNNLFNRWFGIIIAFILLLIPFHAPLSVWMSTVGLSYDAVRLWKEFLLIILIVATAMTIIRDKELAKELYRDWLVRLAVLFIAWCLLSAAMALLFKDVSPRAVGFGLIIDTRMWFFMLVVVVALKRRTRLPVPRLVVGPALLVIAFGLLQMFILPNDFLKHIGYGPDTILPYQAVDNHPDFPRIQSTMRGPNPLGAYLLPVGALLAVGAAKFKYYRGQFTATGIAALIVCYGTYSRSAWVGTVLMACLIAALWIHGRTRQVMLVAVALVLLTGSVGVYMLRENDFIQNTVFHSSETSPSSISSNEQRANALKSGLGDMLRRPQGGGVGSAGPASVHNKKGGHLAENFYIQIGQELGVVGLGMYMALTGLVVHRLYKLRKSPLSASTLAAFCGLIMVNMLSHAWSDDTLSYVIGGLLAYALLTGNLHKKRINTVQ